jgi:hypothetical protein
MIQYSGFQGNSLDGHLSEFPEEPIIAFMVRFEICVILLDFWGIWEFGSLGKTVVGPQIWGCERAAAVKADGTEVQPG